MKYLKDFRNELPLNCMFNKVRVGCGGTTLALTSSSPYVICVPYVSLIDNKITQNPDKLWLGVKSGITKEVIYEYLNECYENDVAPKILVTYDSLPKVTECIDPQEFYILIDEYHILFQQYSFRNEAVRGVLGNYKKYKAFTFMSATPLTPSLDKSFMLAELRDVDYIEQDWQNDPNVIEVKVEAIRCNSIPSKVVDIIKKHLSGEIEGNAYFFVNSVRFINEIYQKVDALNAKNTRVIYSKNNNLVYDFERGETTDAPKKINFLTSMTFEGSDIYDENGVTYIVSDSHRKHTLLDISSSVQQIIGRIRDSRYKGRIVHIYNEDRYANIDPLDFEAEQNKYVVDCKKYAEELNSRLTPELVSVIGQINEKVARYLILRDGKVIYDENLKLLDAYQYEIRNQYVCNASIEASYCNIDADINVTRWIKSLKDMGVMSGEAVSFKEAVKECREASEESIEAEDLAIRKWQVKYPIIREAIEKLGYKRINSLKYVQKEIKDVLLREDKKLHVNLKVVKKLNLEKGCWYAVEEIKDRLKKAYKSLNINETPTAKDIEKYYQVEERAKRVDGKKVRGYIIYF